MSVRYRIVFFLFIFIFIFFHFNTFSQPDCRSVLGSHLKPFSEKFPLQWALEGTGSFGLSDNRNISNAMLFAGLDYTKGKHQLYLEGGYKGFRDSWSYPGKDNLGDNYIGFGLFQQNKPGLREAFYKYKENDKLTLTVGLHSMKSADYFLINERVIGISGTSYKDAFSINFNAGSVVRRFSRMGEFCSVKYIYNVFPVKDEIQAAKDLGKTNLANVVVLWDPHYKKIIKKEDTPDSNPDEFKPLEGTVENSEDEFKPMEDEFKSADDEFKTNEEEFKAFGSNDEGKEKEKSQIKIIKHVGLILHNEFTLSENSSVKWYAGALTHLNLPYQMELKIEVLQQFQQDHNCTGYYTTIARDFNWGKQKSELGAGMMGKINLSDSAVFSPAYSNLWIGEVVRLDTWNAPLVFSHVKHVFPGKNKLFVKLKGAAQLQGNYTKILDLESGIKLYKNFKISGIFSVVDADPINSPYFMGRIEIRITI
ncbi:MAG TPA: hypothetical protein DEH02_15925 [Bacteroidales bacterium]|nr:MAG: hypothetical protein A2X01_05675 [Bacteroidetes bacterium GWF2_35_48]HBX52552.1 hypothetical protein [Bacteroidales bacterium]